MRLSPVGRHARNPDRVEAFTWVGFLASLAAGGLLGSVVQQLVQWRRDRSQRNTEDRRRAEDRAWALADRRTARREAQYVQLLTAVKGYEVVLRSTDYFLDHWTDLHQVIADTGSYYGSAGDLDAVVDSAAGRVADLEQVEQVVRAAVYGAFSVASADVREAALTLAGGTFPMRVEALRVPPGGEVASGLFGEGVMISAATYGRLLNQQVQVLLRTAEQLDTRLRAELDLD